MTPPLVPSLPLAMLLLLLASGSTRILTSASEVDHAEALINWIRSHKDGYVSDKIEIRRMFPDEATSPMGVFAKQDLADEEVILKMPRDLYLKLDKDEVMDTDLYQREDSNMDDIMKVYYGNTCRLAKKLLKEWAKYERDNTQSKYGPYLDYLRTQSIGQLPATYSETGKDLLRKIGGKIEALKKSPNYGNYSLPPWQMVDWIDENFVQTGCFEKMDEKLGYHAVALAIQRGYDTEFIPVWDMFNHHNGKLNLVTNSLHSPEGLKVWTSKEIKAGQELYATYNYCKDCFDVGDDWGTPGMYRDFGFVEDYPQVWPFLDHKIHFELDRDEETGRIVAEFYRDEETGEIKYGLPDEEGLAYLRSHLVRLSDFDITEELKKMGAELYPHEFDTIKRFHRSLKIALTAGIEATTKEMHKDHADKDEL